MIIFDFFRKTLVSLPVSFYELFVFWVKRSEKCQDSATIEAFL